MFVFLILGNKNIYRNIAILNKSQWALLKRNISLNNKTKWP
jgi:hypothetical protein